MDAGDKSRAEIIVQGVTQAPSGAAYGKTDFICGIVSDVGAVVFRTARAFVFMDTEEGANRLGFFIGRRTKRGTTILTTRRITAGRERAGPVGGGNICAFFGEGLPQVLNGTGATNLVAATFDVTV